MSTLEEVEKQDIEEPSHLWNDVRGQLYDVTNDLLAESGRQYQSSLKDSVKTSRNIVDACKNGLRTLWSFLTQPVWVPGKKDTPKQYSRGTLFFLDTVRFGGTFASLFVVLFVSLNFQSFWSIAHSYVDPLSDITAGKQLASQLNQGLTDKLKKVPSLTVAGVNDDDMTAYLPDVGPPENRLIIPKLDLNVPIMVPSNANLIKEDWKALEEDIQTGLQSGVVHYPGTANPGQAGNFFVTGHSSYFPWSPGKYKSVFARLGELDVGDEYWVYYGGDKYRYIVTEKKEIKPSDVSVLDQPVSKRISTLMTCTPVGTTLRRLIITAQEIDPDTGTPMTPGEHPQNDAPKTKAAMLPI
jgi:LPXTG-site transpeptidase (sortase) family protein